MVSKHSPAEGLPIAGNIAAAVINYNTAALTVRCVDSLLEAGIPHILVLDNASNVLDRDLLTERMLQRPPLVQTVFSDKNLGFAGGSNLLIDAILEDPSIRYVLLLNSDAVAVANGVQAMLRAISGSGCAMAGGRIVQDPREPQDGPAIIDSLGITIYRPLLASNRKSLDEIYLGPTGGCAVYARPLLEDLKRLHGYIFDPDYFCYAEDTDLCLRARLLGYQACYVDDVIAHHLGQASSGGGFNSFVLYHGIRNSIWTVLKSVPWSILLLCLPWVVLLHVAIVVSHTLQGEAGTVLRLYRDAIHGLPRMWRKRRTIQSTRRVPIRAIWHLITPRFYEEAYLRAAIRRLASTFSRA